MPREAPRLLVLLVRGEEPGQSGAPPACKPGGLVGGVEEDIDEVHVPSHFRKLQRLAGETLRLGASIPVVIDQRAHTAANR
jgi:hypothetical protein